jgi:hypothetical protein
MSQREKFEEWARPKWSNRNFAYLYPGDSSSDYFSGHIQSAWDAWQAGARVAAPADGWELRAAREIWQYAHGDKFKFNPVGILAIIRKWAKGE